MARAARILVLGGYGGTGKVFCRYLLEQTGFELIVAGRNLQSAQAVLYAHGDDLNLDKDTALKLACAFGAGMARQSQVCGAITGGMLVLSAIYGRVSTP